MIFLVSCSGVNYGAIYHLQEPFEKGVINQALLIIRINPELVDYDYFYYLFSFVLRKAIVSGTGDSTIPNFPPTSVIKNIEVNIPELKEQKRIGRILKSIDAQVKRNNEMVQKLQVLALKSFDYFSKDNDISNSLVLKDIIVEKVKSPIQVNNIQDSTGLIPFFTSGEAVLYTKEKLTTGFNIFLSTGGNAKVQSHYGDAAYSTDTWCISAKNNLQYYLYGYLKHIESQMDKLYFHGTGLKHLQKPIFLKSTINIPDNVALKKYNAVVEPIYIQISNIEQVTIQLLRLKNKLLPLLINQQLV